MSKSIYEEALKNIKDNYPLIHPISYKLIKESYDTLEELIEKAKKQEKLLVFYKDLAEVRKEIYDLIVILKKPKDERLKILFTQEYVISNHIRRLENE